MTVLCICGMQDIKASPVYQLHFGLGGNYCLLILKAVPWAHLHFRARVRIEERSSVSLGISKGLFMRIVSFAYLLRLCAQSGEQAGIMMRQMK